MSDYSQGPGWWQASDGKWYPPESAAPTPAAAPGPFTAPTYNQPSYGQPTYGAYPTQQQPKNGLAIGAMVCGIVGLAGGAFTCGILAPVAIVGVILGHIALSQIKKDPSQEGSRGFAMTGVITGWIAIALGIIAAIVFSIIAITADDIENDFDNNDLDGFCNEDAFLDPDCD